MIQGSPVEVGISFGDHNQLKLCSRRRNYAQSLVELPLSCIIYRFIAWIKEETNLVKTLVKDLIMNIWISPGAKEIVCDRKVTMQVFVQLEGIQAWASGNHVYE
jgi:hypothetical protein